MNIFWFYSQNLSRSNISKQAFFSLFINEYFIKEIIHQLEYYYNHEPIDYESHIMIIIELINSIIIDYNDISNHFLILYGYTFYASFNNLKIKMLELYVNLLFV